MAKVATKDSAPITITPREHKRLRDRAHQSRFINQETQRERLATNGHIGQIINLDKQLTKLAEDVRVAENTEANPHNVDKTIKKSLTQAKIIETRLGIQFRMLNKYLPDLKSVELLTQQGSNKTPEEIFITALSRARKSSKVIEAAVVVDNG